MIHFNCDYMAGAHPSVLQALIDNNTTQTVGYGFDEITTQAKQTIKTACNTPNAEVFFFMGGTQTNATVIDALLRPTEGIIATTTSHINVHEAGAIELNAHKVITLPEHSGKLMPDTLTAYLTDFYNDDTYQHMVRPAAVYISFPTELGTLYTYNELEQLHSICQHHQIPLYIDGARLGYGLAASKDITLQDLPSLCDLFYIGGTKQGALFGEALVCPNPQLLPRFFTLMKAHGAVLAKTKLIALQFQALFTDNLYLQISHHAVNLALRIRNLFTSHGYPLYMDSPTNQQFFTLPNTIIDKLSQHVSFEYWGTRGQTTSNVRFVTSWETTEQNIKLLENLL